MRLRPFLPLAVLLIGVLMSGRAWARPCCTDCPSWPDLDPDTDSCARVCLFSCYAPQAPVSPRPVLSAPAAAPSAFEQIFTRPETAPRPEPKVGGTTPTWCTNRNSSYCTYSWDWMARCCNPSYTAPGAYCPAICE